MCASAGLMLLTACTASEDIAPVAENNDATSDAVTFGVLARQAEPTRSGYPGEIGLGELRNVGFGVFAEYNSYGSGGTSSWNFMDNQQVRYNGAWTYSPVKYWPNMENGGDNYPEVTFYAYAPYVPYKPDEKVVEDTSYGIVELPTAGSPVIKYKVPDDPSKCVDLLYGVAAKDYNAGEYMGSSNNNVNLGASPIILSKLLAGDKVEWEFKHALTKFGVTVDAVIDDVRTGNNGMGVVDPNTRILIESVTIDGLDLYKKGTLKLEAGTGGPDWYDVDEKFTGNEKIATNLNYYKYADPSSPTTPTTYSSFAELPLGVTSTTQYLYASSEYGTDNAHMLIYNSTSGSSSPSTVEIKYHVITKDVNVTGGYTDMVCKTSQNVSLSFGAGYKTMLHLHLGLTSVKMDATITDWDSSEHIIDLPANAKVTAFSFEVLSGSGSSTGIDANGKINVTFKATTTNKDEITLKPNEVSFACGSTKLLVYSDGTGTEYYLPANYTTSARNIYPSFGGVRAAAIEQPALTANDFYVNTNDALGSESITLTVPYDFNYNDWTFSSSAVTVTSTSLSGTDFTITLSNPTNASSWQWTLTHKNGLQLSGHGGA